MAEFPLTTPEVGLFLAAGGLMVAVAEPRSPRQPREIADHRAKASDAIEIVADTLSDPADMKALIHAVAFCREVGNSPQ
jgi:hypothetical protein